MSRTTTDSAVGMEPQSGGMHNENTAVEAIGRLEELARAAAKRAPGLWGSDIEKSEGEYGIGDESRSGFFVPYMETEHGKRLFDAHYCDVAEVHEDYDEDGCHAWDEAAREIFAFLAAVQPQAVLSLIEERRALREALDKASFAIQRLHTDVEALMADSEGVYGLHGNGDPSPWEELREGGRFDDWIGEPLTAARNAWHDARAALDRRAGT